MIVVEHPVIECKANETLLKANIKNEIFGSDFQLWFAVDKLYGEYLCDDRADAFLLAVLMAAMKSHQDIRIQAPVSRKLLFNINNTLQPLFTKMIPKSCCIRIEAQGGYCSTLQGRAVGCGCSLGVDSLSSLYKHLEENVVDGYRVSHLALFNSGQLGYMDKERNEQAFRRAVESIIPFANEINLPIVAVNTNLNELFVKAGFKTALCRILVSIICCPLALQKLFGKYVFASSYSIEDFKISQKDQGYTEAVVAPLLSTESTEIILSGAVMTRVEKTDYIRKNPLTKKYLDVCWAEQLASSACHQVKWLTDKTKKNCGWCDKCLRTLFTMELLGEDIREYEEIFDLKKYYAHKEEFIKTVLLKRNENAFYREIYNLMMEKKFEIPRDIARSIKKNTIKSKIQKGLVIWKRIF